MENNLLELYPNEVKKITDLGYIDIMLKEKKE